jgi:hypothetical protein
MGARKGPIRERVGGRVYGTLEEDDLFDDDQDLELDLESMD